MVISKWKASRYPLDTGSTLNARKVFKSPFYFLLSLIPKIVCYYVFEQNRIPIYVVDGNEAI